MFNCQKMQIHNKITKYNYTNSNYYKTSSKNNNIVHIVIKLRKNAYCTNKRALQKCNCIHNSSNYYYYYYTHSNII